MPITPKNVFSTIAEQGRKVVSGATGLFRHDAEVSKPTSPPVKTPAPAPRAGGTKTGAAPKPTAAKAKTAAAKAKTSAATKPSSARPKAGTSRATPKPVGTGNGAVSSAATTDKTPVGEPKSS
jgi:hypothetical protein